MLNCPYEKVCNSHINSFANYPQKYVNMLQDYYCHGNNQECARYFLGQNLGEKSIPKDLKPYQFAKARILLDREY
jgi:hypothetical protein